MRRQNLLTLTDSYKVTHYRQYQPGTTNIYSYFTSRPGARWPSTVFVLLQYLLKEYLMQGFTQEDVDEARALYHAHFGTDMLSPGWLDMLETYKGQVPLRICAMPEGTLVPSGVPMMTVENTDGRFPWVTNFFESLLVQTWYPSTVATNSREMKKIILEALELSGTPADVTYKLHDFGFRGSTSVESSAIGGAAHLVNFAGTDTVPALLLARDYYGAAMAGHSIPAAEHSTITSWGKACEVDACRNMLEQYPTGLVAVVSDSYDIWRACKDIWGRSLREHVLRRDGRLIIRPDSGNPITLLPELLETLGASFGTTVNAKGYKVLHDKVRLIQGDGIDLVMVREILQALMSQGWSADNLAFGSGGGLLQKVDRDTQRFAFKCSSTIANGHEMPVSKAPASDPTKNSLGGRFAVTQDRDGNLRTEVLPRTSMLPDLLVPVFENGALLKDYTFESIRQRAAI